MSVGFVPLLNFPSFFASFQDEIINLVSSLPLSSVRGPSHVGTIDAGEETKKDDVGDREETPHTRSPAISTPQDGLTTQEPEAVPLVVPAALFRPHSYHPMHIFVSIVIRYWISYFKGSFSPLLFKTKKKNSRHDFWPCC